MKKVRGIQILTLILFLLFFIFLFKPKSYEKEYEINGVKIKEQYQKNDKYYYFTFYYKGKELDFLISQKYKIHRGFVDDIKLVEDNNDFCIIPESKKLDFIPLCIQNEENIHYSLLNNDLKNQLPDSYKVEPDYKEENYHDIKIYQKDSTYFIWKYNGFYYIHGNDKKEINMFQKEKYNVSLIGYTKDYLVVADYNQDGFTFNKFYTISYESGNVKEYKIDRDIYFDSYILGYEDNDLYLIDKKASVIYQFDAKKGKIKKAKNQILRHGKWENISILTLINKPETFTYESNFEYVLENNNLYLNYFEKNIKTKIAENVKKIIRVEDDKIFYLKDEDLYGTVYQFQIQEGEKKVLSNYEWKFNFENIYIY